jgi:hypothetical protein
VPDCRLQGGQWHTPTTCNAEVKLQLLIESIPPNGKYPISAIAALVAFARAASDPPTLSFGQNIL